MDTFGRWGQGQLIKLMEQWGYPNVATLLSGIADSGGELPQKRVVDSYIVLHFDLREAVGKQDERLQAFLRELDALEGSWDRALLTQFVCRHKELLPKAPWGEWDLRDMLISLFLDMLEGILFQPA